MNITTDPAGARVLVDGEPRGTSPLSVTGLSAANHKVTVVSDGGTVRHGRLLTEAGVTSSARRCAAQDRSGLGPDGCAVSAPFEVQAIERGDVIGSSASPRFMVRLARTKWTSSTSTLGYARTQTDRGEPGRHGDNQDRCARLR